MAYVSLGSMPSAKKEYVVNFPQLNGGLNLQELDYRIQNDETPEMINMLWRDGILCCRRGQAWVNETELGEYHSSYDSLWNGKMFIHAGNRIYAVDPETGEADVVYIGSSDMDQHGTFFPYNEKLYYKTKGYYVEIEYDEEIVGSDVEPYVPVTYVNCSYINGSGQVYQPENRLSSAKTLWYDAAYALTINASGGLSAVVEAAFFRMRINVPGVYVFTYSDGWKFGGVEVNTQDYGITVGGSPENGDTLAVVYSWITEYVLPIPDAYITEVVVDDRRLEEEFAVMSVSDRHITAELDRSVWRNKVTESGTYEFVYNYDATPSPGWELDGEIVDISEYGISASRGEEAIITGDTITVDYNRGGYYIQNGRVCFFEAPMAYYPEITNTIHITYEADNEVAYNNIMDCTIATLYGGTGSLCVVMAGSETQPNAYFWNGQTSIAMDPTYFPMTQYQLAGDMVDPVRGFGKQQGYLIIFKDRSIGRTSMDTAEVDGRTTISLAYTPINAKIGCDLPWTIQLIENNLTWCNTEQGVHFLANTSSAYENNVVCISQKIESSNSRWTTGLLDDVREKDPEKITSHDDGKRYWLIADGEVWLWDYYVSNYKNPAWFYFNNIPGRGFIQEGANIWHFDSLGRLTAFMDHYADYDGPIQKVYRFATQYFGTYDNNKTVNSVIINMRPFTNSEVDLTYITDYERRKDLTPLKAVSWSLVPRDLSYRNLSGSGFARIYRRKPHCRRVQYFTMKLENNTKDMDMAIVSAQIYYIFQGRYR